MEAAMVQMIETIPRQTGRGERHQLATAPEQPFTGYSLNRGLRQELPRLTFFPDIWLWSIRLMKTLVPK